MGADYLLKTINRVLSEKQKILNIERVVSFNKRFIFRFFQK